MKKKTLFWFRIFVSDALSGVVLGFGPSHSIVDFSHVCIGNWAKKFVRLWMTSLVSVQTLSPKDCK